MSNSSRQPTWMPSAFKELEGGFEVGFLYIVIEDSTQRKLTLTINPKQVENKKNVSDS
jgi:hypothetical protein